LQLGEAFVGEGPNAAHVNTVLGGRDGSVGTAWATALATPSQGHAPFVVVRFERRDDEFVAQLNDATQEVVDPATLRVGPGDVPYGRVKGGRFEARFSRAAAHQLWGLAEHDEPTGRSVLRRGRSEYTLRRSR